MTALNTVLLSPTDRGIRAAASLLNAGETVAFPTETVYGLGADATQGRAVAKIFEAKDRPRFNPLIVHVADRTMAERHAMFSPEANALADAFWPGPLTLVLPRRADSPLADLIAGGLDTVAIRVPAHPVAHALLTAFNGPVAAPSANRSGRISPTSAAHVLATLRGRVSAVIDGGECPVGLESTIIGFEDGTPVLLRPGGIPAEAIRDLAPDLLERKGSKITAPGQMASHYAPEVTLRLNAEAPEPDELFLAFGPLGNHPGLTLSETHDLREAAANLFASLHEIDDMARLGGIGKVAVQTIPETGLGAAINDRLRRAAAPRP
jgi:L-threonylcarbamoyladenylate synthase